MEPSSVACFNNSSCATAALSVFLSMFSCVTLVSSPVNCNKSSPIAS